MKSLPMPWVDRIFQKLTLTYGRAFSQQYEGLDPEVVKADWAEKLAGFTHMPDALAYGLDHLPDDKPVNALQFRAICRQCPPPKVAALPAPGGAMNQQVAEKVMAELKTRVQPMASDDGKNWARRILEQAEGGKKLRPIHLAMARTALGL